MVAHRKTLDLKEWNESFNKNSKSYVTTIEDKIKIDENTIYKRKICRNRGGLWARYGLLNKYQCTLPTKDAGKKCDDHRDCESVCITENRVQKGIKTHGKCFEKTIALGMCFNFVTNGKATGLICED